MRTIERFGRFKRDYKREKKGQHAKTLDADLIPIIEAFVTIDKTSSVASITTSGTRTCVSSPHART